ncbi:MAG: hypothetical protein AB1403_26255, partial [Candidatus Riflebacteria bacterium]
MNSIQKFLLLMLVFCCLVSAAQAQNLIPLRILEKPVDGCVAVKNLSESNGLPDKFALNLSSLPQEITRECHARLKTGALIQVELAYQDKACESGYTCSYLEFPKADRTIFEGQISEILHSGPEADPDIKGMLTITGADGETSSFIVQTWTLILIRHQGKLWAGRLDQLKTGWQCSLAYDLPADEDDNCDFATDIHIADNMIV